MRQLVGLSHDGESITLKRFHGLTIPEKSMTPESDKRSSRIGLVLDVETTGMDRVRDKIIDLGYILFEYDVHTGSILSIIKKFEALEDPKEPLSPLIQRLTGLTDSDLKDQSINWDEVTSDFQQAQLVISHNASFDRGFIDRYIPISREKVWGCSLTQVAWREKGHGTSALEYLCKDHGFFFKGHRAFADVEATLNLLSFVDPSTSVTYLSELLLSARKEMKWVYAYNAAFSFKDILKGRGYVWDGTKRVWKILVPKDNTEEENFLEKEKPLSGAPAVEPLKLTDTFKNYQ